MSYDLLHTRFRNEALSFQVHPETRFGREGRKYSCADFTDGKGFKIRVSLEDTTLQSQVSYVKECDFHSLSEINKLHGAVGKALSFYRLMEMVVERIKRDES